MMDFAKLPVFANWPEERDQLSAQRFALRRKVERGAMSVQQAAQADADVVRRLLTDLVRAGKIDPHHAEQHFSLLECGSLLPIPDAARFDPMRETYWTLTMVLAWIMWRTSADVRRYWDQWRKEMKDWRFVGPGYSIRAKEPSSVAELRCDEFITEFNRGNAPPHLI